MKHFILTIVAILAAASATVAAQTATPIKAPAQHSATHARTAARNAAEASEMHLASVSRTNPFEIIAPESMHLTEPADVDAAQLSADMLGFARKFIGTRYRIGGKAPKSGFDCSGFTGYVFKNFGFSLASNSKGQYLQGRKVLKDEIQPGDLVFFTGRGRSGHVGHVGIAVSNDPVSGEITFIHAATSKGICIEKLSAPYYASRFLGARRVLPD